MQLGLIDRLDGIYLIGFAVCACSNKGVALTKELIRDEYVLVVEVR